MTQALAAACVRARGLVVALAVFVLGLGVVQLQSMPIDVLPEFGDVRVEIRTEALGLSAYEVEQLITAPMEQNLLNGVAFLEDISSKSVPGLSSVELIFEDGTDPFDARQVVQERLTEASVALPNVSKAPQMLQPLSATSRVMMVGLKATDVPLLTMSKLAFWTLRPQLMGVPGVANVSIWGQRDQQLQVLVDPERLYAEGVTLDQVIATAGNGLWVSPLTFLKAAAPGRGGFIDTPAQRLGVQHINPILTPEDLARVAIEPPSGAAITPTTGEVPPGRQLGEVTTVVEGHQPLIGDGLVTDGTGLMLVVEKLPGANAIDVTRGIERELATLAPGLAGIEIQSSVFRPATYLETSRDNLLGAGLIGAALGVIALAALTFSWRSVLVTVVSAAVSLAGTVVVLAWMGQTLNVMILAGIVLGISVVIDDAVSDGQSIAGQLSRSPAEDAAPRTPPMDDAVTQSILQGSSAVRSPLSYATVMLVVILVPLFVLTGEGEAFVAVAARAFAVAILVSMVVAMTVTPATVRLLVPRVGQRRPSPITRRAERAFARFSQRSLGQPLVAVAALGLLAIVGISSLAVLERPESLMPEFKDTDLLVQWEGPVGTSLPEMNRISARVGAELRALPGIDNVGAHTGRAVLSDDIGGANAGELWVSIDPTADYESTVDAIKEVVTGYPGILRDVTQYSSDRIAAILDPVEGDITVRVFGQEHAILEEKAAEIERGLKAIDGITSTRVEQLSIEPTVEVNVDLTASEAAGITPGEVRRAAATYLQGLEVGALFVEQKVFDVIVQGVPEIRESLQDIENLPIATPASGLVRLADLAEVKVAPNPSVIKHEAASRSLDVHAEVSGDPGDLAGDVKALVARTSFPLEHHAQVLGDQGDRASARTWFLRVAIGAAVLAFLLLQAAFTSWKLAIATFVTLPTALAGGVLAAWISGDLITIGSVLGFLAVLCISIRFTVVMVRRFQYPHDPYADEPADATAELVSAGAQERFMPVLTTVVVGVAVLLPFVLAGPRAGNEVIHPMAIVVMGGLMSAGVFALLIVPTLYLAMAPGGVTLLPGGRRQPRPAGPQGNGQTTPPDDNRPLRVGGTS